MIFFFQMRDLFAYIQVFPLVIVDKDLTETFCGQCTGDGRRGTDPVLASCDGLPVVCLFTELKFF